MNVEYAKQVRVLSTKIAEKNIEVSSAFRQHQSLHEIQKLKDELFELRTQLRAARHKITH